MAQVLPGRSPPISGRSFPGSAALPQFLFGILLSAFVVVFAFCIWSLDRGFDITDESYALLLAIYPKVFKVFVSAAHWITSPLWALTGSLYAFRASGLAIVLLAALTLALGVIRASALCGLTIMPGYRSRIAIVVTTLVVALHWETYGTSVFFTPQYNLLATAGSYSAIGFALLAAGRGHDWRGSFLRLLVGGSLGIVFLSKFPAGINVSALTLVVTAACAFKMSERVVGVALIFVGIAATILLVTLSQMTLPAALENFRLGMQFYGVALQEPPSVRLLRNVNEFATHWAETAIQFAWPLAFFVAYALFNHRFLAFIGIALLVAFVTTQGYMLGGKPQLSPQIIALVAMMAMFVLATVQIWARGVRPALLSASLLVLPYCVALGTNNSLPPQILVSLAPWGSFFALISYNSNLPERIRIVPLLLCVIFAVVSGAQVVASGFAPSYHMAHSLSEQDGSVRIGALGPVRVDGQIREFVTALTDAAERCSIAPGRPFLGFYNVPGVALVIQGVPILTPWLVWPEQARAWLKAAPPDELLNATVALQSLPDGSAPPVSDILPKFPDKYRLCGTAAFPYENQRIQLWAPGR